MDRWMDLGRIFDLGQWEVVQNSLAEMTGLAIITVDYKGRPRTIHSGCREFCRKVREDEELGQYCQKCDARGGLEAVRTNKPYIYKCYFSIIDVAIPIIVRDQYIGAIMAGEVRLPKSDGESSMEQIYVPANKRYVEDKRASLMEDYEKIPLLSFGRIQAAARLLFCLCNYMVGQSVHKEQLIESCAQLCMKNGLEQEFLALAAGQERTAGVLAQEKGMGALAQRMDAGRRTQEKSSGILQQENDTDAVAHESAVADYSQDWENGLLRHQDSSNPIILDVFSYISAHRDESPSLAKMAKYCNVSTGYLSRLFSKEVGESYSSFNSRLKVEWAKALLESTDKSVYEISDELGFSEAGYFIKIFKKHVGMTPAAYRSYLRVP